MSKVILKISFKHPNRKGTSNKNVAHLTYIATRPGVDKSINTEDLNKSVKTAETNTNKNTNLDTQNDDYIKYIHERPRSHGLFDAEGQPDLDQVKNEIKEAKGYVWRCIISIKEDDAKELGYIDKEKWVDTIRNKIPDMAKEMNIRLENLRWVGAIHKEKGHPHAHVMIWENEPEKRQGVISEKRITNMRKILTDEIFADERINLLTQKDVMRDLIRDLANNDVSQAARLIKEVNDTSVELRSLEPSLNKEGVPPKMYPEDEIELAEKIKLLSEIMPGHGRVMLKFMPDNVKDMVRSIADDLLNKHEFAASLQLNLNAVEELTKMYTGKEDAIQTAKDNAYKDIRDRVCQIILKGAVESQRDNVFDVDTELSQKAVDFIKKISTKINLIPEQTKVLNQVSAALVLAGYSDETILNTLNDFLNKNNIDYAESSIKNIVKQIRESGDIHPDIGALSNPKKIDYYLSAIKLSDATEKEAFESLKVIINNNCKELENRLTTLTDEGFLNAKNNLFKMTNKGIDEILKIKELDRAEAEILNMLDSDEHEAKTISFTEFLDNKNIFGNLRNKDPDEFKIGKYDTKIREIFGEDNKITIEELENRTYEKYTDDEINSNADRPEQDFEIMLNRIKKLTLNGYVELDKALGTYSFSKDSEDYFEYNDEKEIYVLSKVAMQIFDIPEEMEFTQYDANVTLSYIDKTEDGILSAGQLKYFLDQEIANSTAQSYYEKFTELFESELKDVTKFYITSYQDGTLSSTQEGKRLGINLSKLNKYFKDADGSLTDEKLIELCSTDIEFQNVSKLLVNEINKGHIELDQNTGVYKINSTIHYINNLLYQIYKEGGSLNKDELKQVCERNIPNYESEKQFKYLTWRLNNLKQQRYLEGGEGQYQLTSKGIEKRADILIPERDLLKKTLSYLGRLGLITSTDEGYQATQKYYTYKNNVAASKEEKANRTSDYISQDIYELIDRTQDNVNVGKIRRANERIATDKYINDEYKDINTGYEDIRTVCGVQDTIVNTIKKLSTTLFVSGVDLKSTQEILNQWNIKSYSNIDPDKLNNIIDKAYKSVSDNNLWGKTTIISTKEWQTMFEALGVEEKHMPKWIYKGSNWQMYHSNIGLSIINDIWKNAWKVLERDRLRTEAQAEMMKRNLVKQQAATQSKAALKEEAQKSKDKGGYEPDIE